MWITQFFSFISLVIVTTSYAHPTTNLRDVNPNAIVSVVADETATDDHGAEIKHPMVVQSKPRIVVSYGNVYKQTPVDPIQNLLTYFLMNVARDFAQDQDQFERRRSPGFFTDAKTSLTDFGNKVVNESENIGQKVGDAFKSIATREIPAQTRYEEAHFYPHVDGTCMCFNRLIRHGAVEMKNDLHVKENRINSDQFNENLPIESRSKDVMTMGQIKTDKTIDIKTENNNVISNKEKNTVALAEIPPEMQPPIIKQNSTSSVRVLKVLDLDSLETNSPSVDTTESKIQLEQKVGGNSMVEQKAPSLVHVELRREPPIGKLPFIGEGLIKKEDPSDNKNRTEDDGIYFLSLSGGTDKRTTATDLKTLEDRHYANLLPKYEDKLPHLREMKRRRRRRKRHHKHLPYKRSRNRNHRHEIAVKKEKFRTRNKRYEENKGNILLGSKLAQGFPNLTQEDMSFILPNFLNDDDQDIQHRAHEEQATQQTMFLTVTLPTFIGVGLALLALCYFLRTTGWCCKLFLDKSNIVVMDVNQPATTPETRE